MNQFEDMQTFVRIVEAGSITKAAEQMDTVKSAISRRLSDLEKRLGVTLLNRTTRRQTLTDSGESYYQQCIKIIDDVAEVEASVKNEHCALAGRIKLAAPLTFGLTHLSQAILKFNQLHPEVLFELDFNDRKVDIIEEGFDLAFRIANLEDSSMIARKITSTRLLICASPDYLKLHGTPQQPEDLKEGHVKLKYQSASENWLFKNSLAKEIVIKVPTQMISNNGQFLCRAAIEGYGLTLLPDFVAYKAIRLGQLKTVLDEYLMHNCIDAYAVYPQTRHLSQRVRSLVEFLQQYFGDKPYWRVGSSPNC